MNTQYDTIERGNRDKSRVVNLYLCKYLLCDRELEHGAEECTFV